MKRLLGLVLFLTGLLAACAPFSRQIMDQIDPTLTLQEIQKDPQKYLGKTALWGGVIIDTINRQNETLIKVTQTELDFEKSPKNLDHSLGRFLVRHPGFLDPDIYKKGREITVAGEVVGTEILPVGEVKYVYPVILAKAIQLWEKPQVYQPYYPPWYWGPYPYWWGPYHYWR